MPIIGLRDGRAQRLAVVRTALIMTGVESAEEATNLARTVMDVGLAGARGTAGYGEIGATLRALSQNAGGRGRDTYRQEIAATIKAAMDRIEKRKEGGEASLEEVRLQDAWNAAAGARLAALNPVCGVDSGETKGRVFLYAITGPGLQQVQHAFTGVPMIIEVQYDPPAGEAEMMIDVAFGGDTTKMSIKRFDPKGYIYRSDPFVPGRAPLTKGDVFDPAPPPKPPRGGL